MIHLMTVAICLTKKLGKSVSGQHGRMWRTACLLGAASRRPPYGSPSPCEASAVPSLREDITALQARKWGEA